MDSLFSISSLKLLDIQQAFSQGENRKCYTLALLAANALPENYCNKGQTLL